MSIGAASGVTGGNANILSMWVRRYQLGKSKRGLSETRQKFNRARLKQQSL